MSKQRLIIFYRNPVLGKVKTRLAADLGEIKALDTYLQLCSYTCSMIKGIAYSIVVYYDEVIISNDLWNGVSAEKKLQQGNSLGDRMLNAFRQEFQQTAGPVVIMGTDCPALKTNHLVEAFDFLTQKDLVIGPATDGGYYLLGMNKLQSELFINKSWGGSTVFKATMVDAESLGLSVHLLPALSDVDRKEDLIHMKNIPGKTD